MTRIMIRVAPGQATRVTRKSQTVRPAGVMGWERAVVIGGRGGLPELEEHGLLVREAPLEVQPLPHPPLSERRTVTSRAAQKPLPSLRLLSHRRMRGGRFLKACLTSASSCASVPAHACMRAPCRCPSPLRRCQMGNAPLALAWHVRQRHQGKCMHACTVLMPRW